MLYAAVTGMKKLFELGDKRRAAPRREIPGNKTATMRALSDLGESVASGVHVIYSPVRLYLCVAMEPKPDALRAQIDADQRAAKGMFEVDENWSAAEVNARWAKRATLVDGAGHVLYGAVSGARGLTDVGAKEVFFEFGAMETYPEAMYLVSGDTRVRVR
ncbi:MAG: hypothetical protein Q4G52_00295 [Clostridia bacterium]|nr:hypothetical protein [Clostridia bacterium]